MAPEQEETKEEDSQQSQLMRLASLLAQSVRLIHSEFHFHFQTNSFLSKSERTKPEVQAKGYIQSLLNCRVKSQQQKLKWTKPRPRWRKHKQLSMPQEKDQKDAVNLEVLQANKQRRRKSKIQTLGDQSV